MLGVRSEGCNQSYGAREIVKYHPEFGLPADEAAVNTFRAMANAAGHEIRIPEGVIEAADV
jgi:hypothetical protein